MPDRPVLGIVGAGKVGQSLARLLYSSGYYIAAVHSQTESRAGALAQLVNATVTNSPRQVLDMADLVLLTVPDDVIESLAQAMASGDLSGKGVIHTSGAHGAESLAALAERGAMIGSLHPAYPFTDVETTLDRLRGITFALEAEDERLVVWLGDIVSTLDGTILRIPPGGKALYHAALVFISNYTVTLYAVAERLLLTLSEDRAAVDQTLNTLLGATAVNLCDEGVPDALTGPLVRGDTGTIAAHLAALKAHDPALAAIYQRLARLSIPMLRARGISTEAVEALLDRMS